VFTELLPGKVLIKSVETTTTTIPCFEDVKYEFSVGLLNARERVKREENQPNVPLLIYETLGNTRCRPQLGESWLRCK
jgi:hypothetical protein